MVAKTTTHACGTDAEAADRTRRIALLNDALRTRGEGGMLAVTDGVLALANGLLPVIVRQVGTFTDFTPDNDPYGEHDFGAFEWQGVTLFWKIDYYDTAMAFGSDDPADPALTTRLLTIMLASEY